MLNLISKIDNIFAYLYYRSYQFFERHHKIFLARPEKSAIGPVLVIKMFVFCDILFFILIPFDEIFLNSCMMNFMKGLLLPLESLSLFQSILCLALIVFWGTLWIGWTENRYKKKFILWEYETKKVRKKRGWILFLSCSIILLSFFLLPFYYHIIYH